MAGQQRFLLVLGGVAIAAVGWLGWKMTAGPTLPVRAAVGARDTTGFQGYVTGSADAPVEIVEYADFQCPICAGFDQVQYPDLKRRLIDAGKIRLVHRDWTLDEAHPHARLAAHAAACFDDQQKFWEGKTELYRRHGEWNFGSTRQAYGLFGDIAASIGTDRAAWEQCMESGRHAARIQSSKDEGTRIGVTGTPTFLINGRLYPGQSSDAMVRLVDSLIAAGATSAP